MTQTDVPIVEVFRFRRLTQRNIVRGLWSRDNLLRPFERPAEIRMMRLPPIAGCRPPDLPLASLARPDGWGGGQRMLLVDDNHYYLRQISGWFRTLGWDIDAVATAAEATVLVQQRGVDYYAAVVSDISMEMELAGIYLCYTLRRVGFRGITLLASTGFDNWFGMFFVRLLTPGNGPQWIAPKAGFRNGRVTMHRVRRFL
ncbi:MAG: hypothetical protein AB7K09_11975 [Planctomycetota bacterium]